MTVNFEPLRQLYANNIVILQNIDFDYTKNCNK